MSVSNDEQNTESKLAENTDTQAVVDSKDIQQPNRSGEYAPVEFSEDELISMQPSHTNARGVEGAVFIDAGIIKVSYDHGFGVVAGICVIIVVVGLVRKFLWS